MSIVSYVGRIARPELSDKPRYRSESIGVEVRFNSKLEDAEKDGFDMVSYISYGGYHDNVMVAKGYGKFKNVCYINAECNLWHRTISAWNIARELGNRGLDENITIITVPFSLLCSIKGKRSVFRRWTSFSQSEANEFFRNVRVIPGSSREQLSCAIYRYEIKHDDGVETFFALEKYQREHYAISKSIGELEKIHIKELLPYSKENITIGQMFAERETEVLRGFQDFDAVAECNTLNNTELKNAKVQAVYHTYYHKPAGIGLEYHREVYNGQDENGVDLGYSRKKECWIFGEDEGQMFASHIPHFKNIGEAYEVFKPKEVRKYEAEAQKQCLRQGEWFFVPVCSLQDFINHGLPNTEAQIQRIKKLFGVGHKALPKTNELSNNHMVKQFVIDKDIYVYGKVRHPEHRTLDLSDTVHLAYRNTSYMDFSVSGAGVD